jgi:hypothetical protein
MSYTVAEMMAYQLVGEATDWMETVDIRSAVDQVIALADRIRAERAAATSEVAVPVPA